MKITLAQIDISVDDQHQNVEKFFSIIEKNSKDSDVIVFPELWNTGFRFDNIEDTAIEEDHMLFNKISKICTDNSCCIVAGSIIEKSADKYYNTSYAINENGEIVGKYSKIHLFKPMDEHTCITSGKDISVFNLKETKCALSICYDIRFPELYRKIILKGAEIIFLCAQFPKPRQDHWDILCKARAIENQCFFVAANRVGTQKTTEFFGHSQIVDPWGSVLNNITEEETVISVDIDVEEVKRTRKRLSVLEDIVLINADKGV